MSEAEVANLNLKGQGNVNATEKFHVLQMQEADMEACAKVGATIGGGSESEIEQLGRYGLLLGTVTGLREDMLTALNVTGELADKIKSGNLPYVLTWSINHSKRAQALLSSLTAKEKIRPVDVKNVVKIIFESNAISHVKKLSNELTKKMESTLVEIRECEAKRSLELMAAIQRSLLFRYLAVS